MTEIGLGGTIFTVVEVIRGVASGAYSFSHLQDAVLCAERLREGRNLQEDDVRLFESTVDYYRRDK